MSGKLKFLLAVLAVGAGLAFWYVASYLDTGLTANISSTLSSINSTPSIQDTDNDGLSDSDETYWQTDFRVPDTDGDGYTDGEEVLSGHDPAKAGPNDLLNNKQNLTQRASTLLLGGIATGDLDTSSPNYESAIDGLADQLFEQYSTNTTIELDSIITTGNSQMEILKYGTAMSRILQSLFANTEKGLISIVDTIKNVRIDALSTLNKDNPTQYVQFTSAIRTQIAELDTQASVIKNIKVPSSMLDAHKNELLFVRGMQQQYRALLAIERDPLQGIIAMQVLETLTTKTSAQLTLDFSNRLSSALK